MTAATTTAVPAPRPFSLALPWANGGTIDPRFTCDGADLSPLMTWTAPPAGTVELALLVTDDDANGYVHWAVAGIPPTAGEKGEGATITGAVEGVNDFGETGWGGPCPPAGAPHTYRFSSYALASRRAARRIQRGRTRGHRRPATIATSELIGTYARGG